jgi:hypothetical protein
MLFSLDVLHARKGDCLMLHYGPGDDPRLIIIDGGPSNVYLPHLKPRIAQVHEARGLEEEDPLPVDVVMISHVDDDHIKGILELTKEQRGEPDLRLDVTSLWHNSFDDLLKTRPDELVIEASFGAASLGGNGGDGGALMQDPCWLDSGRLPSPATLRWKTRTNIRLFKFLPVFRRVASCVTTRESSAGGRITSSRESWFLRPILQSP